MPLNRKQIIIEVPSAIPDLIKTTADGNDYVLMVDSSGMPYKITKDNLLVGLSSGTGTGSTGTGSTGTGSTGTGSTGTTNKTLTFSSNGDTNGLFYWLGTAKGTKAWLNPDGTDLLNATASSTGFGTVHSLCDQADTEFYTNSNSNSWVKFQILSGKLKCNYYSIRNRYRSDSDAQHSLRNWKLQGSNDDAIWVDLDTRINNTFLDTSSKWLSLPVSPTTAAYSYFRILQNGVNSNNYDYLCLGEVELYGEYTA
ncbi:MAG: hypothetical protein V7K18_08400 [Nostoc sp.]|uniref:hypothetical protein n=1 Tax=Nostoc sp. TaxID=1180 RepID=UPI002FF8E2B0